MDKKGILEIRFHGRGGQGSKTACMLLGEAALEGGKYIQSFPEYGPERTGAPVRAFTRISSERIRIHSGVVNPEVVVVLDPTLIESQNVLDGLKEKGKIIINTEKTPSEMKEELTPQKQCRIYTVDATGIALETLGRPVMNVPMLGALVKVTGVVNIEVLKEKIKSWFGGKLSPSAVEANLKGIERAAEEVKHE